MLKKIIEIFKNKYVLTLLVFLTWMLFFDNHNIISQKRLTNELKNYQRIREYYLDEIRKDSIATQELMTNTKNLEKFAREKYLMKKENEDIYLIVDEE